MDGGFEALWGSMVLGPRSSVVVDRVTSVPIGLRRAKRKGVVFWVGPLECRKEVVEV